MGINPNSYGTVEQVAALTRRYTNSGVFDTGTNPAKTTVEIWIDNASASVNVALAAAGFTIPITQADAKAAVSQLVIEAVCDLVNFANSAGRFFSERALERGLAPAKVIRKEMADWVEEQADGLEALGAARSRSLMGGILFRDSDEQGNPTAPIFQRNGFSNRFEDWDA